MTKTKLELKRLDLGDKFASSDSDAAVQWLVTSSLEGSTSTIVRNLVRDSKSRVQVNTFMGNFTKLLKIEADEGKIVLFLDPATGELFNDRKRANKSEQTIPSSVFLIVE